MNYLEEAKKFGGTPVPSDTKIDFLEEARKMGGTPVPAPQVNYFDAAKQFGGTPIPASPTADTVVNPFAQAGVAATPVLDKSFSPLEEITKGAKSGVSSVKSIPTATGAFVDVGAALTNLNVASLYDKIDKGEITDPLQIKGSDFEASRARMYLNSKPEMRKVLRDRATQEVEARKENLQTAANILQQYQKENLVNKGRTEDITDVEGLTDFTNWAAYNLGSGGVQLVPIIAAAATTGGLGVFATGTAMELSGGVQTRLNYILDKTKDIQDPKAKADAVFDYVAKSGDVTLASALASGAVDLVLGPAAEIIKRPAAQLVKEQTRKEIAKEIPKAVIKQGGEEFLAGGIQETIQIAAERALGEQTGDFLTKENIKRIVNAAAAESVAGAGYGGGAKAVQAAFAKPGVAPGTREAEAMAGLDTLADKEDAAAAAKVAAEGKPAARTLEDLTEAEVDTIQRQLFAQYGRPATYEELEGAFNDYLAEQNASAGIEPGADVAGVPSDRVAEAAGVPDTGVPATPEEGRLADVGEPAEPVAAREGVQPATLEEATDAYEEAEAARDEAQREVTQLQDAIDEIGYEGSREDVAELNRMLTEAEARYEGARQAADAAFKNYTRLAEQELGISSEEVVTEPTEGIPSEEDVAAAAPKAEEVITEAPPKPVFALPEGYAHGTDYLTAQKIIQQGRLAPDAGKRMYSYSQFGRKAVYLTARNGWWLDSDKAADGRAMPYESSVPFKLDSKANIREVNTKAELDAIAREIGEKDSGEMMRKLSVENLDYEQEARKVKGLSFEDFVKQEVNRRRERLKKFDAPGADTVTDVDSWAEQEAKEMPEFARSKEDILSTLREQYDFLKNYENEYKDADEVTQKLIDAGIDGIYVGPNFEQITQEEYEAFDKVYDGVAARMPNADPRDVYNTATDEYSKINPTYFERLENIVASDQLALFRPELAVVDRARLAAARPTFATASELPRVDSIERFPLGPTSIKPTVVAENKPLYRETNAGGVDDLLREDLQFGYAPVFVTDNPDLALGQGDNVGAMVEFRPNSVSGKVNPKPIPGAITGNEYQADVIAPRAIQSITFTDQKVANRLSAFSKRALQQRFTKEVLPDGRVKYTRKAETKPALAASDYTRQPEETEEEYRERLLMTPKSKMSADIVDRLRDNDLNGALQIIAKRFKSGPKIRTFYGELAERLAALNLPTEVRIGDQRNLTRRSIDDTSGPQQVRLFSYLRTKQPQFFDEYFKNYDRVESLEAVYAGLLELQKFNFQKILGPVINEYYDVVRAYKDNFVGISANGAYYTRFDTLNLNDSVGRSNGMDYHTFLHEATHAATETLLNTPAELRTPEQNEAIEELRTLYKYTKERVLTEDYGLTNLSEFIAEVFTNKNFQDKLRNIPYTPARTNIFKKFIQTIARLFGMDNVAGRAMVEAEKLFSAERPLQTISAGPRFMTAKRKRKPAGPISTPDTYRTATDQQNMFIQTMRDAAEGRMEWKEAIKILGPALWDTKNTKLRQVTFPVLNLTHLEDLTRTKFTQITGAVKIIRDMVAYRAKKMNVASDIVRDWTRLQKKNFAQSQLMGRIMLEATIRGRDPDAGVPSGVAPDALDKAWNTLKPEYKEVYRKVRNFYSDSVTQMVQEMKRRAAAIPDPVARAKALQRIDEQFGPDKLVKPYFPLRRFGEYWYQVGERNNKEFYMFESEKDRNAAFNLRRNQLSKGNAQQRALISSMRMGNGISELYGRNLSTTQALKDVQDLIDGVTATDVADLKDQLNDSLNQLIYILLPQQSVRKMFVHRKKNVQGASADMLRVFATTAVHSAYQQSRFMFAEKFLQNLNNARSEIDGARQMGMLTPEQASTYNDFILEVEKRVPYIMSNEDKSLAARVAAKASELTFFYMLSAPFSALLNNIGAVQIALPYLGGPYGYRRASALMVKNLMRYLATTPSRIISPLAKGTFSQIEFPSLIENKNLSPLLKRAAQRFVDDGSIDISVTNDVMNLGDRPSELYTGRYENVKKVLSGLFHQSERLNREVILLTGFELAYEKFLNDYQRQPGMEGLRGVYLRDAQGNKIKNTPDQAFELAIEESTRIAALSLGDYSRQMKGRVFAHPAGMVLLKFKQYPVLAMYAVLRNSDLAFRPFSEAEIDQYRALLEKEFGNAPNKDQIIEQRVEEVQAQMKDMRREGRRRLAGILGTSTVLGGAAASPLFSVVGLLFQMFSDEDDEDDYFNWENWFLNYMENEFGGYLGAMLANAGVKPETAEKMGRTLGEVGARGVPSAMGAALADRISLDPKALLWRDGRFSPDAREDFIESLIANSGPVVGLALQGTEAYQLAKDGQYARAVEKMVPAIIAKPLSAIRMKEEGAKTKGGDVLVDDFTMTELAMQAIGLQPERLAQKQKAASAIKLKEQQIKAERAAIMDRLWMERDDPDAYAEQYDRAMEFSAKHPDLRIKPSQIRESFKKREKAARDAEAFGARIDKKLRGELREMGEFAEDED